MKELLTSFGVQQSQIPKIFDDWMAQVFIVVFIALVLNFFLKRVLDKVALKFEKTVNPWDDAMIEAVRRPATTLVWILGISFAAHIIKQETGEAIFDVVNPLRDVGVIFCLAWFLIRLARGVEQNIIARNMKEDPAYDKTTAVAIGKLVRLSLLITSGLIGLQTMGISISGVLAFGGVGGIAVGFAARDLLANFFGGLMIYLDRPFSVGDWVRSPDRNIEGTVEDIGWRLTRIRTFDKRPLYVPNSIFTNIAVENPSRMKNRRIKETIGLRYDDVSKVSVIIEDVRQMLLNHPEIDTSQTLIVNFDSFGASSLDFFIYTFTKTTNWVEFHSIKHDVLLRIAEIVESHNAEFAFPTQTLHLPNGVTTASKGSDHG